jgi:hypothetical protein
VLEANNSLKMNLKTQGENLEKSKKETKFYVKEAKRYEEEFKNTIQEHEEVKNKFEKLHSITHGKFKKK